MCWFFRDLRPEIVWVTSEVCLPVGFQKELGLEVAKGYHGDIQFGYITTTTTTTTTENQLHLTQKLG